VSVDPPSVYLGVVQWGETATQELTLTNDGDAAAEATLVDPSNELTLDDAGPFTIEPGTTSMRELAWTPTTMDACRRDSKSWDRMSVHGALRDRRDGVPDHGRILRAPRFRSGPRGLRSGGVSSSAERRSRRAGSSRPRWTASPFETGSVNHSTRRSSSRRVAAAILQRHLRTLIARPGSADAVLALTTNDPSLPLFELDLRGEGVANELQTIEWTAGSEPLTIVVQVNTSILSLTLGDPSMHSSGPSYETLNAARATYRVAFILGADVGGDVPYIDDAFASADAVDAARGMLEYESSVGDNDAGLETCLQFIGGNDWAVDDSGWPNRSSTRS
jgi:hypothetical protein